MFQTLFGSDLFVEGGVWRSQLAITLVLVALHALVVLGGSNAEDAPSNTGITGPHGDTTRSTQVIGVTTSTKMRFLFGRNSRHVEGS